MLDKIRIVIAEDHAVVRQGTRSLLEREADLEVVGEVADGMQERAQLLGGTLAIDAAAGKGTTLTVEVPLQ